MQPNQRRKTTWAPIPPPFTYNRTQTLPVFTSQQIVGATRKVAITGLVADHRMVAADRRMVAVDRQMVAADRQMVAVDRRMIAAVAYTVTTWVLDRYQSTHLVVVAAGAD